jgi:hypothetical protein
MRLEDYMANFGVDGNMFHVVGYLVENEATREADGEYWVLIQEGHFSELRERSAEGCNHHRSLIGNGITKLPEDLQGRQKGRILEISSR